MTKHKVILTKKVNKKKEVELELPAYFNIENIGYEARFVKVTEKSITTIDLFYKEYVINFDMFIDKPTFPKEYLKYQTTEEEWNKFLAHIKEFTEKGLSDLF